MVKDDETSLSKLCTLRFNDKMTVLNGDFLKCLRTWYEQCPHYDFTDTAKSYMRHVEQLEKDYRLYKLPREGQTELKVPNQIQTEVSISTPASVAPRFNAGNVSAIAHSADSPPNLDRPRTTPGARKRVIRGGGSEGQAESVHFRGKEPESVTSKLTVPPITIEVPKPSAGFWDKHKDKSHVGTLPVFNLVKPTQDVQLQSNKNNETPKPAVNFENDNKEISNMKKSENVINPVSKFTQDIISPDQKKNESPKPIFTLGGNIKGISSADKTENIFKPTQNIFPLVQKSNESPKPLFTFGKVDKKEPTSTDKTEIESKPILTFGTTAPTLSFNAPAKLTFGTAIPQTNNDDEEEEYVPPKVEIVENEEPGATYSIKCSVFQLIDKKFEKKGVGMLHLKEVDSKKSVLIRAATPIGTIWLNSLINSAMKVSKPSDEKGEKLRITVPINTTEIGIFLIRFPNEAAAEFVQKHIEANQQ